MSAAIRVLVVDDSALMRQMITAMLEADQDIEVVGVAADAMQAREKIKQLNPDVVTLDVEMPKMNGLSFLTKIMKLRPMPVVMVSSLTQEGADITLQALEIGAVDFVAKPEGREISGLNEVADELISKVKTAAKAQIRAFDVEDVKPAPMPKIATGETGKDKKAIVIGASTGGVEALRNLLVPLPTTMPPIFVVQHMPAQFTNTFAQRLDHLCQLRVKEAEHGEVARSGTVYVAPGGQHLKVIEQNGNYVCVLDSNNPVGGHIPSVDTLFQSICELSPEKTVGIILSGMGKDGANGLKEMKLRGAYNIGQCEHSCVVYGMPRAAADINALDVQVDITQMSTHLLNVCK